MKETASADDVTFFAQPEVGKAVQEGSENKVVDLLGDFLNLPALCNSAPCQNVKVLLLELLYSNNKLKRG